MNLRAARHAEPRGWAHYSTKIGDTTFEEGHMNSTRTSRISLVAIAIAAFTFSLAVRAQAQTETVLYNFPGGSPGRFPVGGIVFDHAGNLYGTASSDGF